MSNKILSSQHQGHINQIQKIIKSWDLIPGAPLDEFDILANKLLSHLYKGMDVAKIQNIIASDLIAIYGFYSHEIDAESFANEIMDWWIGQQ